jgi:hypothetical protein
MQGKTMNIPRCRECGARAELDYKRTCKECNLIAKIKKEGRQTEFDDSIVKGKVAMSGFRSGAGKQRKPVKR